MMGKTTFFTLPVPVLNALNIISTNGKIIPSLAQKIWKWKCFYEGFVVYRFGEKDEYSA